MKNLNYLNDFRKPHPINGHMGNEFNGYFEISGMKILASSGDRIGWEHVSVSKENKQLPKWGEMCKVKEMFFEDEETVVQFHPKKSEYINNVAYVLHLWKKKGEEYELPPSLALGFKELNK